MVLKIFAHPLSQPCRAVYLFCRMNSIPFQEVYVDLAKGEQFAKDFTQKNPLQKIPLIEHDGFLLPESVAILRYLARTFPTSPHWYPSDSHQQAKIDSYMAWQHLNTRFFGSMYFQTVSLIPKMTNQPVNEKKALQYKKGLEKVLDQISSTWLNPGPFISGKEISIADLLAVTELEQPGMAGYDVKSHEGIAKYMETVRSRLMPHYDEVHALCHKIQKKNLGQQKAA